MKVQVRQGLFETNSSSTHAICIAKKELNDNYKLPKSIEFDLGSFGWEIDEYHDIFSKASYLYTGYVEIMGSKIYHEERMKDENYREWKECDVKASLIFKDKIKELLPDIECEFEDVENTKTYYYIDHSDDGVGSFINYVLSSRENLIAYLVNDNSTIFTGNDNDDDGNVDDYDFNKLLVMDTIDTIFYKGN